MFRKTNLLSRRQMLKGALFGASVPVVSAALSACSGASTAAEQMTHNTTSEPAQQGMTADEMDAMHLAGIKEFLAGNSTTGVANLPLEPTMDGDVKVFSLLAKETDWQVTSKITVKAWTYNGTMPGPEIRVTEGDKVRVVIKNELPESTAIHFHGLIVPNAMDGVPGITQPPIKPGETFTYEFTVRNSGSHMYHSHHNATKQVGKGLLGAFVVLPKDQSKEPVVDQDITMILNDSNGGFTLNGKGFPATAPIPAKLGEKLRIRYMNEGLMIHPMHLHGIPQLVIARDGWMLPQPYMCDTVNVAPGERWDVLVDCTEPGAWAFHCHILSHAESEHGMFGMVTALVVA
jgi:manganese oxidase